jgi:hypothetical protein
MIKDIKHGQTTTQVIFDEGVLCMFTKHFYELEEYFLQQQTIKKKQRCNINKDETKL